MKCKFCTEIKETSHVYLNCTILGKNYYVCDKGHYFNKCV